MDQRDPRTQAIIGAALEVHRCLGHGFAEPVYQQALEVEFRIRGLPFDSQRPLQITYKEHVLEAGYRPDFTCFDSIIVELKALSALSGTEVAQVINYLKIAGFQVGLLLNFGRPRLEIKRLVWGSSEYDLSSRPESSAEDAEGAEGEQAE